MQREHQFRTSQPPITFGDLTPGQRRLIRLMQQVGFGRIEQVAIHAGEVDWSVRPKVTQTVKLASSVVSATRSPLTETTTLKSEWVELLLHIMQMGEGVVTCVHVAHGLPQFAELEMEMAMADEGGTA